jgi:hypothetical protein
MAASSAQLKVAETVVAGIRSSEMGMDDDSEKVTVGNGGSVWVDIDAEEDEGMIRGFVWTKQLRV